MKAVLSPQGTAEKPNPGLLTTKESHSCCQWPPRPEPERLMCFMRFFKSTVHWYAVKWFTCPSSVKSFQNHRCLRGFWKVKYPDRATAFPCNSLAGRLYNFPTTKRPRDIFCLNSFLSSACKMILSTDNGVSRRRIIPVIQ